MTPLEAEPPRPTGGERAATPLRRRPARSRAPIDVAGRRRRSRAAAPAGAALADGRGLVPDVRHRDRCAAAHARACAPSARRIARARARRRRRRRELRRAERRAAAAAGEGRRRSPRSRPRRSSSPTTTSTAGRRRPTPAAGRHDAGRRRSRPSTPVTPVTPTPTTTPTTTHDDHDDRAAAEARRPSPILVGADRRLALRPVAARDGVGRPVARARRRPQHVVVRHDARRRRHERRLPGRPRERRRPCRSCGC